MSTVKHWGPRRRLEQVQEVETRTPGISVVIPVYNEEENILQLHKEIVDALDPLDMPFEIVYVNDCSTDSSPRMLEELASNRVRVLHLQQNRGQSAAMALGFRISRHRLVTTLDADLQNDPADIPRLLKAMEGYDVICGIRTKRQDTPWRRFASRFANRVRQKVTGDPTTDTGCTLKVFKAEVVENMPMFRGMHRFLAGLARQDGYRVHEIPVNHRPRVAGLSKYGTFDRLKQSVPDLLGVAWLKSRYLDFEVKEYSREEARREV